MRLKNNARIYLLYRLSVSTINVVLLRVCVVGCVLYVLVCCCTYVYIVSVFVYILYVHVYVGMCMLCSSRKYPEFFLSLPSTLGSRSNYFAVDDSCDALVIVIGATFC